jgi:predicted SprT family Zn-dependent metalloprotease
MGCDLVVCGYGVIRDVHGTSTMTRAWRYQCPEGHTMGSIRHRATKEQTYYCVECETAFKQLHDSKTDGPAQPEL